MSTNPQSVVDGMFDAMFGTALGRIPRPRKPTARDHALPVRVAELEASDGSLSPAFIDAFLRGVPTAMLNAYRTNDDAELGRLLRQAIGNRLAEVADLDLSEEEI